jgi:hypothetical protein
MSLPLRLLAAFASTLLACAPALAQKPIAPEPHLALDELVKEYKRLGLLLPPANAELVRVKTMNYPDQLGFRIPAKPGHYPGTVIGANTWKETCEVVKPEPAAILDVEPRWVSDYVCLAIQCRERGWNDFAALLFARAQEAITTPVPARVKVVELSAMFGGGKGSTGRLNGWELRTANSSAVKELRRVAASYWSGQVMAKESVRKEALRHLKELAPESEDVRDLELTLAPRKSKPGSVEALIDDLTDYGFWRKRAFESLDEKERGEAAYRKLVEMGFDAVPALLNAVKDRRLTRSFHFEGGEPNPFGIQSYLVPSRVGQVVGQILNDLAGRELSADVDAPWLNEQKAREWWKKAQKEGEEKWLVAHLSAESMPGEFLAPPANAVIFRAMGAKYPSRLAEFYRTVLRKRPEDESNVLADEVAGSKLPRAEKLALLEEGAAHEQLVHRVAALGALAELDPEAFRKHLVAALKRVAPDAENRFPWTPEVDLAGFVLRTNDPACWKALADAARRVSLSIRSQIIGQMGYAITPDQDKKARREQIQFLMKFLGDETHEKAVDIKTDEGSYSSSGTPAVRDTAAHTLAGVLGLTTEFDRNRGPVSRLFIRAAVTKAAMEELARLKK